MPAVQGNHQGPGAARVVILGHVQRILGVLVGTRPVDDPGLGLNTGNRRLQLIPARQGVRQHPVFPQLRQLGAQIVQDVFAEREGPAALHIGDNEVRLGAGQKRGVGIFQLFQGFQPFLVEGLTAVRRFEALECGVQGGKDIAPGPVKHVLLGLLDLAQMHVLLQPLESPQEDQDFFFLSTDNGLIVCC